jgi:hypothetical protein
MPARCAQSTIDRKTGHAGRAWRRRGPPRSGRPA